MAALSAMHIQQAMHSIKSSGTEESRALEGVWHGMAGLLGNVRKKMCKGNVQEMPR